MVQAGKRLAPGDPDRSLPKGPKLEAWDLIRFLWRGQLRLKATEVDVALGITAEPDLIASTPRLQVPGPAEADPPALIDTLAVAVSIQVGIWVSSRSSELLQRHGTSQLPFAAHLCLLSDCPRFLVACRCKHTPWTCS